MTGKHKKPSRLMQVVLETVTDMQQAGILTDEAYGKITMRHLGVKDKSDLEQLTGEDSYVQKH
ncbi:MAG: hypothetical protein ACOZF2_06035 [Thermodesulfobacteriota bacterium]